MKTLQERLEQIEGFLSEAVRHAEHRRDADALEQLIECVGHLFQLVRDDMEDRKPK